MHRPEYIQIINDASTSLGIEVKCLTNNWVIQLSKEKILHYIIGYTFPLNSADCYKIAQNKNVCSDIFSLKGIPNVPHELLLSPRILQKRGNKNGNYHQIEEFKSMYDFPFLIKKNNSSKGEGVYLINSETDLENVLGNVYLTDASLCLSPFRENIREYRCVILDAECLVCYEKKIPFLLGNDKQSVLALLSDFLEKNKCKNTKNAFHDSLLPNLQYIPKINEKIFLQWKHNRFLGTSYEIVSNRDIEVLAIEAANAINGRFVCVDIIESKRFGLEVLEINASVSIHFPITHPKSGHLFDKETDIYKLALEKLFN